MRKHAVEHKRASGILADLQGPKIRITRFKDKKIHLEQGWLLSLWMWSWTKAPCDEERVGVTYKNLPKDVKLGDILIVDDGNIVLEVTEVLDPIVKNQSSDWWRVIRFQRDKPKGRRIDRSVTDAQRHQDIRLAG